MADLKTTVRLDDRDTAGLLALASTLGTGVNATLLRGLHALALDLLAAAPVSLHPEYLKRHAGDALYIFAAYADATAGKGMAKLEPAGVSFVPVSIETDAGLVACRRALALPDLTDDQRVRFLDLAQTLANRLAQEQPNAAATLRDERLDLLRELVSRRPDDKRFAACLADLESEGQQ